tara:strand:- start:27342 stop:28310 length:969 start_codon:yes stop_codon:yes gene_type:complete
MDSNFNIINIEPIGYSKNALDELKKFGHVDELELTRAQLLKQIGKYHVLIVRLSYEIDKNVIDAATNLVAIVSATTGLDHIDKEYADSKGIQILSLQGEAKFMDTVSASAEHTWALILALQRKIPSAFTSVQDGQWNRDDYKGHDLDGAKLGIVGLGRVGRKIANYGLAFNMDVMAFDSHNSHWHSSVDRAECLDDLLQYGDVVTLHVPLNNDTKNMIRAKQIGQMRDGSVLINTSRGQLIDEQALLSALESGKLSGAALDVLSDERLITKLNINPLLEYARKYENLIITPHIAGATHESMAKTELFMAKKLGKYLSEIKNN